MKEAIDIKQLRSFGFLVGGIFGLLGFVPLLFGREIRLWAIIPSGILLLLGSVLPKTLGPAYRAWMKIGHILGWINTRIILSIVFYGMFVPMGFIMRLAGKDPMRREFKSDITTYRVSCTPRPGSHMLRQF
jgi:Saxitoxin biosynthesis operon protein SxtJ